MTTAFKSQLELRYMTTFKKYLWKIHCMSTASKNITRFPFVKVILLMFLKFLYIKDRTQKKHVSTDSIFLN